MAREITVTDIPEQYDSYSYAKFKGKSFSLGALKIALIEAWSTTDRNSASIPLAVIGMSTFLGGNFGGFSNTQNASMYCHTASGRTGEPCVEVFVLTISSSSERRFYALWGV